MTDPVQTAIYQMGVDPSEYKSGMQDAAAANESFLNSADQVAVKTETIDKVTRSTADSIARLEARVDSSVAAEQRRQAALQTVQRALEEGTISQQRGLEVTQKVNDFYGKNLPTSFRGFSEVATSSFEKVEVAAETFGTLIGVSLAGGLAEMTKHTLESTGALEGQAKQLGENVETFQAQRIAAEQADVSNDDFTSGLNKLSKQLGEAQSGVLKSQDVFTKWGIAIRDGNGNLLNLQQVLPEVADRMNSIHDAQLRSAFSSELLGHNTFALINYLSGGSAAMLAAEQHARSLGAVIGEDTVKEANAASNELKLMGDVISANLATALVDVLPSAQHMADIFERIGDTARIAADVIKGDFSQAVVDIAKKNIDDNAVHAREVKAGAKEDQAARAAALGDLPTPLTPSDSSGGFRPGNPEASRALDDYLKKLQHLHDFNSLNARDQAIQKAVNDAQSVALQHNVSLTDSYTKSVKAAAAANYDLEHAIAGQKALDDYLAKLQNLHDLNSLSARDQAIQKSVNEAESIARQHDTKATDDYIQKVKEAAGANYDHAQSVQAIADASKELSSDLVSGIDSIVKQSATLGQAFGTLLNQLEDILLKAALMKPIENAANTFFSNSAGGVGGFLGDVFGGIFGGGRAAGGPVSAGMLYAVNENSIGGAKELFAPSVSGNVIPLGGSLPQSSSAGIGSVNTTVNVKFDGSSGTSPNPQAARNMSAQLGAAVEAAVTTAIMKQQRPGGLLYNAG